MQSFKIQKLNILRKSEIFSPENYEEGYPCMGTKYYKDRMKNNLVTFSSLITLHHTSFNAKLNSDPSSKTFGHHFLCESIFVDTFRG